MTEKDIIHENGNVWVMRGKDAYYVMVNNITHSESESAYPLTDDGLSIAIARCNWCASRPAYQHGVYRHA